MSRDSSRTFIHMHASRFADLFEDFSSASVLQNSHSQSNSTTTNAVQTPMGFLSSAATHSSHIPHEDILVPFQHQPINPEDEDDVVPDQHAAFGITKAMQAREGRERVWRDFESLRGLVRGDQLTDGAPRSAALALRSRTDFPR